MYENHESVRQSPKVSLAFRALPNLSLRSLTSMMQPNGLSRALNTTLLLSSHHSFQVLILSLAPSQRTLPSSELELIIFVFRHSLA